MKYTLKKILLSLFLFLTMGTVFAKSEIDSSISDMDKKIAILEERNKGIEKGNENTNTLIALIISAITLITVVNKIIEKKEKTKDDEKYDKLIKSQEERTGILVVATKENIETTTNLISSLTNVFNLKKETDDLRNELKDEVDLLNEKNRKNEEIRIEKIRDLNTKAIILCKKIRRDEYKNLSYQNLIKDFNTQLSGAQLDLDIKELELNPNCYLLKSLDGILKSLYDRALNDLTTAIDKAKKNITDLDINLYPSFKSIDEVIVWNNKLVNICLFHQAIIMYNFGYYNKSEGLFREAIKYDSRDVKSMIYIPEAQFLGGYGQFNSIIKEFEAIEEKIKNEISDGWNQTKDEHLAILHLKKGNCYYYKCVNKEYGEFDKLRDAITEYEKAVKLNKESYINIFSLGQALLLKAETNFKNVSEKEKEELKKETIILFSRVIEMVKLRLGSVTEAKIAIMLYYILVICSGVVSNYSSILPYLALIYEKANLLPKLFFEGEYREIKIYSPKSKKDLNYQDILEELNSLEKNKI